MAIASVGFKAPSSVGCSELDRITRVDRQDRAQTSQKVPVQRLVSWFYLVSSHGHLSSKNGRIGYRA